MATEVTRRRFAHIVGIACASMWLTSCVLIATATVPAGAASSWWVRTALAGVALEQVRADGATVIVRTTSGLTLRSLDAGHTFIPVPGNPQVSSVAEARSGQDTWRIDAHGIV